MRSTRTRPVRPVTIGCAAVVLAAAMALAGCVADTTPPPQTPTPSETETTVNGLPDGVEQDTDVPTDVPNTPELRADVEMTGCDAADGGWSASGTAKNSGDAGRTYTITVFFTTDGGTVLGTGDTEVTIEAGESADWEVVAELTPAPTTLCVLRGVG